MHDTLTQSAMKADNDTDEGVKLTPLGVLVLLAAAAGICFAGWKWLGEPNSLASVVAHTATQSPETGSRPQVAPPKALAVPVQQKGAMTQEASGKQEQGNTSIKIAVSHALAQQNLQQIADLDAAVKALEETVNNLPKATTQPVRTARNEALDTAKDLHKKAESARTSASVDVNDLPIEVVSAASMNVTGFGKGVVAIGSQRLSAGQSFGQGETVVAIDAESHSIVTTRRIINVTN